MAAEEIYQEPPEEEELGDREIWNPEPELAEDPLILAKARKRVLKIPKVLPSRFTEFAFRMPRDDGMGYDNFSFEGRRHMRRIYDTPAKRVLLFCARQVEKSVTVDSPILLADGSFRAAKDVRVGDRVVSSVGHKTSVGTVTWKSRTYQKPCRVLRTRQGHEVVVADTHPMRVWDGWEDSAQLQVGSRVAVVRRAGVFVGKRQPRERITLTAYLIGDGMLEENQLSLISQPGLKLSEFCGDVLAVTGKKPGLSGKKGTDAVRARICNGSQVHSWFAEDGLLNTRSDEKFIPPWVFGLARSDTALFLNRLWSTDGHVKRNNRSKYSLEYCSISRRLVKQVQALLWKFGIPSRIRRNWPNIYKRRKQKKYAYILRVETQNGVRAFLEEIGALEKGAAPPSVEENNNRDTFPKEINELIRRIISSRRGPHINRKTKPSLRSAGLRETLMYPPSPKKVGRYVAFFRSDARFDQRLVDELESVLDTDFYWDRVTSVRRKGELTCVDFTVDNGSSFVADGFVTHNSTSLGNLALCYICMVPAYKVLYVSPSNTQTKTFSNDRIKEPIETSPVLKRFTTRKLSDNILEKQFINRSKITMRYAFLNADRTRGIPAWLLEIDEFQDVLSDNLPVIEQCLSHAPERWRRYIYAGTPKSLDNSIEYYRERMSTQGEWVVPCDHHTPRFWNILGEKNIGRHGLVCEKCKKPLDPMHPDAQWARMVQEAPFESYRIPQLMVPWKPWSEIVLDYERYPRDKFYNEVLGISYDSGLRPLTTEQVRVCCNQDILMGDYEKYRPLAYSQPVFAGIDWGCHDEDTRILTGEGFKYFRDLTDEDVVAQWDPDTREMSFTKPKVRTVKEWSQPLLHLKTRGGLDTMVTHTHRMRVGVGQGERWVTEPASELALRGGNVTFVGWLNWQGAERTTFTLPGLPKSPGYAGCSERVYSMDNWLEFLGYLLSEGGVCHNRGGNPSCLKMSQRETVNPEKYAKIQECLDKMSIPHTAFPNPKMGDVNWTIYGKQFWQWVVDNCGDLASEKRIPREFLGLSGRQLRILFRAMVDGDGYTDPRTGCDSGAYYSTSKKLCEDFQELCIRLGRRCVVRLHKPAAGNRKARWRAMWSTGRDYTLNRPSTSIERVPYSGKVYCCSVPTGYIVTERNGCISYQGNTGEHAYTVITLATYMDMKFRVFYVHRFVGEEVDPPIQLERICELIDFFNVALIGTDYGGGFDRNDHLIRKFGPQRVWKYQYMSRVKKKVEWDSKLGRFKLHRTEVMSDIFNAVKRGDKCQFPRWQEFKDPYATDFLNIFSEYNETLRTIEYKHGVDKPDDTFHSFLYAWLVSMIKIPRPDIILPRREDDKGMQVPIYTGTTYQG